jgi:hypothetical protein
MKSAGIGLVTTILIAFAVSTSSGGDIGFRSEHDGRRVDAYFNHIADYFNVPFREVIQLHRRGITEEEVPVILFISTRSGVDASLIVRARLRGASWMEISRRYGISERAYRATVRETSVGARGNSRGRDARGSERSRGRYVIDDAGIILAVHLMFMKGHYGCGEEEIMLMRERGKGFVSIDCDLSERGRSSTDDVRGRRDDRRRTGRESTDGRYR